MNKILQTLLLSFLMIACNAKKDADIKLETAVKQEVRKTELKEKTKNDSIHNLVKNQIEQIVTKLDSVSKKVDQEFIFSKYLLKDSYQSSKFNPLWSSKKNRIDLVDALENADKNGLLPKDYHLSKIKRYTAKYEQLDAEALAKLDVLLTDGAILYAYHLIKGKIQPEKLIPTWNFKQNAIPKYALTLLQNAIKEHKVKEVLHQLEPQDKEYVLLKKQLSVLKNIKEKSGWNAVSFTKTLHPGDKNLHLNQLRNRLLAEHFLDENTQTSDSIYDVNLQEGVKKFQRAHGVNDDAVIGKSTLKMLNEPVTKKIEKIIANLERRRWIHYPKDTAYIKVNIASFKMQFIENNKTVYSSRVVVGQTKKKTPSFRDELELIVLNPTWTLPYSISTQETLPKLQKNPNYLNTHNMILMDRSGKVISSSSVDWSSVNKSSFPYRIRQKSGASNALGRVKFLFPNKYAIYLHDTPSKRLFSKDRRAFSHGCIRLENPLNFADFLLKKEDASWNREKIDKIIASNRTKTIRLKHKYPIFIIYQTAGINEKGDFIYYNDIYKRDGKLYDLLSKPL